MSKLPVISGEKAVKCFEKLGYVIVRQKGSHIRMRHKYDKDRKPLTIPKHKVLGKGLLRKLLRGAEISVEEFRELL
jgi:predicted RNA binding protein YcfA (HicA-like mRNA interferase family)